MGAGLGITVTVPKIGIVGFVTTDNGCENLKPVIPDPATNVPLGRCGGGHNPLLATVQLSPTHSAALPLQE